MQRGETRERLEDCRFHCFDQVDGMGLNTENVGEKGDRAEGR